MGLQLRRQGQHGRGVRQLPAQEARRPRPTADPHRAGHRVQHAGPTGARWPGGRRRVRGAGWRARDPPPPPPPAAGGDRGRRPDHLRRRHLQRPAVLPDHPGGPAAAGGGLPGGPGPPLVLRPRPAGAGRAARRALRPRHAVHRPDRHDADGQVARPHRPPRPAGCLPQRRRPLRARPGRRPGGAGAAGHLRSAAEPPGHRPGPPLLRLRRQGPFGPDHPGQAARPRSAGHSGLLLHHLGHRTRGRELPGPGQAPGRRQRA